VGVGAANVAAAVRTRTDDARFAERIVLRTEDQSEAKPLKRAASILILRFLGT
jgi:hypothetical protein